MGLDGNTINFQNIVVQEAGIYNFLLYYCSGENRTVTLVVNEKDEYQISSLNSGDYVHPAMAETKVKLAAGKNTIEILNKTAYAPDIDRIAISNEVAE